MLGNTTNIDYKELRQKLDAPFFVQWVTRHWPAGQVEVVGYCVRNQKTYETLFYHKNYEVCEKICQMLNEEEEHNNVRRA